MHEDFEIYVASLSGFLNALERLTESKIILFNGYFKIEKELETSLKKYVLNWKDKPQLISCDIISNSEFNAFLQKELYAKIEATENIIYNLDWQLQEHFGLVSTSLNTDGVYHPLVNGPIYLASVSTNDFTKNYVFAVQIENYAFFIGIRNK